MSTDTSVYAKVIPGRRVLVAGLMILLAITITTGFVWIYTNRVVVSSGLNLIGDLWKLFICRCPNFPDLLSSF